MISMDRQYRTRDGREVELFAIRDGRVYGRECSNDGWQSNSWSIENIDPYLIELKPKITRTYWLAHYGDDRPAEVAWDKRPSELYRPHLIAITGPHEITFTEGDGL